MSTIATTAKELKKWSQLIIKIRPNRSFKDCPDPQAPDYKKKESWVAHPNIASKALLKPTDHNETIVNEVPTFFIHPTSFFGGDNWNAELNEEKSRQLIEELVLPAQASVFNHLGDIYAPIYRQATFYSFMASSRDCLLYTSPSPRDRG